jgi:chromosome partitioning protein
MFSVAVLHQKGGSGKTTLAICLAAAAHLEGHRTTLIDLDSQASALAWSAERPEGSRLAGISVALAVAPSHRKVPLSSLRDLTAAYDVAILDGPAREPGITRSAAAFADVALVPIAPGPTDLWSVRDTVESLDAADEVRADLGLPPVRRAFVVNAARKGSVLQREAQAEIEASLGDCLGTVHHRVSLPAALSRGETVLTLPVATEAAVEITRLWRALKGAYAAQLKAEAPRRPRGGGRRNVALRR